MSRLKELIGEIHRRSLWQVLLIYIGGALVGYQAIQALTEGLGLPQWFPALAILLFIVGLPIVLATSFVQEGISSARQDSTLLPESGVPVAAEVAGARRLLTWRKAILGGAIAFGLWGVGVTGWLLIAEKADQDLAQASADRRSIAVLPFTDMSPEGDQVYFGDGVAEEILNALAKIEGLRVAARTSAFKLRDEDVATVGERLSVSTVLEGSVRKQENRVRVTAQLVNVADGFHLWSDTFERELNDIFAVQDEVARAIVGALRIELSGRPAPTVARTTSVDAHERYLVGLHHFHLRRESSLRRALEMFSQAIAADSSYARAYAGLALTYAVVPFYSDIPVRESTPKGLAAAYRALVLDSTVAEAYAALGDLRLHGEYDLHGAESALRRALELNPSLAQAHGWLAETLMVLGRTEEALAEGRRGLELDPLSLVANYLYGMLLLESGQTDAAIAQHERTVQLDSTFATSLQTLAVAYLHAGRYVEAAAAYRRYADLVGPETRVLEQVALAAADPAAKAAAIRALDAIREPSWRMPAYTIALAHVQLGQRDRALDWLETAYDAHDVRLPYVFNSVLFARLQSDDRFKALGARLKVNLF